MTADYSSVQKLSMAGIFIASILCGTGGLAPFWIVFDPKTQGSPLLGVLVDVTKELVNGNIGLFIYCIEVVGDKGCEVWYSTDDSPGWVYSCRGTGLVCIFVGFFCGLSSLCLACCRCCDRFIALGFLTALAAACGGFAAGGFARNMDVFTSSVAGFSAFSFGWAFYVFCCGVGLMGISSIAACFSTPERTSSVGGLILSQPVQPQQPQIVYTS